MKVPLMLKTLLLLLPACSFINKTQSQVVTVFSENFDGVVNPYTAGVPFTNANCSDFIIATNYDPGVCNFLGFPISTDASGTGKFLFEGTIDNGVIYSDNFYTTTVNATLFAGITYTIQFEVTLANNINPPVITASLNGTPLGAAFSPTSINSWQTISYTITPVADMINPVFNLNDAQPTGNGNDFGIDNIKFTYTSSGALPVHFTGFSAQAGKTGILLQWSTADETANKYFVIERAADKMNYTIIGTVNGLNNRTTVSNYSFVDTKPVVGTSYYRLKQVDNDGRYIYTDIVTTRFSSIAMATISTYPNPVTNNFTIALAGVGIGAYTVSLTDLFGTVLLNRELAAVNGQLKVRLNSIIAPGIYTVRVKGNNTDAVSKIVVH